MKDNKGVVKQGVLSWTDVQQKGEHKMKDDQMTNFDEGKQYSGYDPNYGYNLNGQTQQGQYVCIRIR